jgi:peptide/nickel transport system substrate-binding protein
MGRQEKILLVILVGIAAASFSVILNRWYINHTKAVAAAGGDYSEGIIGQPRLVNPLLATTDTDTALIRLIFSGLYKYDASGELIPDLAESMPELSADQKTYTVHLRHNVKWQNDNDFDADDVVFTVKTLQDPAYNSPFRSEWLNTTVEEVDDYTVKFQVKDISGPFVSNLTLPIINRSIWSKVDADDFILSQNNLEAVGTGPYFIKEIKKLPQGKVQSIKLEAFSNHYQGRPHLDSVHFVFYDNYEDILHALHGRQIDGFGFLPFDKNLFLDKDNKSLHIAQLPLPQYQAVFFNLSNKIFADKAVRQAFSVATDKQQVIDQIFSGNGRLLAGPVLPEQVSNLPTAINNFDVAAATKALDAAGWKIDPNTNLRTKNNTPLEFTLATNDFALNAQTAELLAQQWRALNAKVNLNILPTKELTENILRPRKFDALLYAQKLGADPDPFVFWHSSQSKNPGLNLPGFNNPAADKLISEARTTTKKEVRDEKYRQLQRLIADEAPAIFLNQSVYIYALDQSIKGLHLQNLFDESYRFYDLTNWYLDEQRVWQ